MLHRQAATAKTAERVTHTVQSTHVHFPIESKSEKYRSFEIFSFLLLLSLNSFSYSLCVSGETVPLIFRVELNKT